MKKPIGIIMSEKKPIKVKHAELDRANDESVFKSICPVCKEGVLLVSRNRTTYKLVEEDYCILCGQQFIYTDIDELRKKAGE